MNRPLQIFIAIAIGGDEALEVAKRGGRLCGVERKSDKEDNGYGKKKLLNLRDEFGVSSSFAMEYPLVIEFFFFSFSKK